VSVNVSLSQADVLSKLMDGSSCIFAWMIPSAYVPTYPTPSGQRAGLRRSRARVQIAAATLSGNSIRQTVHTHRASVHQAAKLVAALLMIANVTAGLAESKGTLPAGL